MRNLINNNNFGIIQIIGFMVLSIGVPLLFYFLSLLFDNGLHSKEYGIFLIPLIIIFCGIGLVSKKNWSRIMLVIFWVLLLIGVVTNISFGYFDSEDFFLIIGALGIGLGFIALLFNQKINAEIKDKSEEILYDDILDA